MSTDRDTTRIVRSWLRTDEHESADRVLGIVLDLLDTTPQRRSWWPSRRSLALNIYAKLAAAAAAVVVIAVIGFNLLPGLGSLGGPGPTPTPTPTVVPTPEPTPTPVARFPASGELPIGRTTLIENGLALSLDFTESGWISNGSWSIGNGPGIRPDGMGPDNGEFIFWDADVPIGVYSDPCGHVKAPPAGPSMAERAAAIATMPGTSLVSGPTNMVLGGHPAMLTVINVPADAPCPGGDSGFRLWYSAGTYRWATTGGATYRVWIIDVDGALIWIDGETYPGATPAIGATMEAIVNSIQFE
jgi:hypothetical protein